MEVSEIVLRGVLSSVYKMDDGEVDALLKSTDGNAVLADVLNKDKSRISELRTNQYQDGFKAAKKEVLSSFEESLRTKYQITDKTLQGESLIESIVLSHVEKNSDPSKKDAKITDDDIKKHPLYVTLEQEKTKAVVDKETEWQNKYNERETFYQKENKFATIKDKALSILSSETFVYPSDNEIAMNQKGVVIDALKGYDYEEANGITYPLKDGKRVEDGHGNIITIDDFINQTAKRYIPIKQSSGGSNPAPASGNDGGGGSKAKYIPKDSADYVRYISDKSIALEDRQAVANEYGEKF